LTIINISDTQLAITPSDVPPEDSPPYVEKPTTDSHKDIKQFTISTTYFYNFNMDLPIY